ncbi:MAG: hypothetical protein H7A53_12930 [Akkermansiaceae bacterium]|nr:hypothetical protein [Akkermansiaceae bacterium]
MAASFVPVAVAAPVAAAAAEPPRRTGLAALPTRGTVSNEAPPARAAEPGAAPPIPGRGEAPAAPAPATPPPTDGAISRSLPFGGAPQGLEPFEPLDDVVPEDLASFQDAIAASAEPETECDSDGMVLKAESGPEFPTANVFASVDERPAAPDTETAAPEAAAPAPVLAAPVAPVAPVSPPAAPVVPALTAAKPADESPKESLEKMESSGASEIFAAETAIDIEAVDDAAWKTVNARIQPPAGPESLALPESGPPPATETAGKKMVESANMAAAKALAAISAAHKQGAAPVSETIPVPVPVPVPTPVAELAPAPAPSPVQAITETPPFPLVAESAPEPAAPEPVVPEPAAPESAPGFSPEMLWNQSGESEPRTATLPAPLTAETVNEPVAGERIEVAAADTVESAAPAPAPEPVAEIAAPAEVPEPPAAEPTPEPAASSSTGETETPPANDPEGPVAESETAGEAAEVPEILNVLCPGCAKGLSLRREHLGVAGQCVWCQEPIVAAVSGMDGMVRLFRIVLPESADADAAPVKAGEVLAEKTGLETEAKAPVEAEPVPVAPTEPAISIPVPAPAPEPVSEIVAEPVLPLAAEAPIPSVPPAAAPEIIENLATAIAPAAPTPELPVDAAPIPPAPTAEAPVSPAPAAPTLETPAAAPVPIPDAPASAEAIPVAEPSQAPVAEAVSDAAALGAGFPATAPTKPELASTPRWTPPKPLAGLPTRSTPIVSIPENAPAAADAGNAESPAPEAPPVGSPFANLAGSGVIRGIPKSAQPAAEVPKPAENAWPGASDASVPLPAGGGILGPGALPEKKLSFGDSPNAQLSPLPEPKKAAGPDVLAAGGNDSPFASVFPGTPSPSPSPASDGQAGETSSRWGFPGSLPPAEPGGAGGNAAAAAAFPRRSLLAGGEGSFGGESTELPSSLPAKKETGFDFVEAATSKKAAAAAAPPEPAETTPSWSPPGEPDPESAADPASHNITHAPLAPAPAPKDATRKRPSTIKLVAVLIVVVGLVSGIGAASFFWQDIKAKVVEPIREAFYQRIGADAPGSKAVTDDAAPAKPAPKPAAKPTQAPKTPAAPKPADATAAPPVGEPTAQVLPDGEAIEIMPTPNSALSSLPGSTLSEPASTPVIADPGDRTATP